MPSRTRKSLPTLLSSLIAALIGASLIMGWYIAIWVIFIVSMCFLILTMLVAMSA